MIIHSFGRIDRIDGEPLRSSAVSVGDHNERSELITQWSWVVPSSLTSAS